MSLSQYTAILLLLLTALSQVVIADVDYLSAIKPLLLEKCSSCHGAVRQEAGLRLDHGELLRRGSDDGRIVDLEHAADSKLLQRVTSDDVSMRMPPEEAGAPLTKEQVQLLTEWIAAGAQSPDDEVKPASPDQHWAWQVLQRPEVPVPADDAWSQNPIDAFVFAKLQEHRRIPLPVADKRTLLRRLYFDLIGLPPTRQEQIDFLEDSSAHAWSDLVDRLLEDPAHGERWARHWMDVWRYSDWDGYQDELRGSQRHIWRWRDWIIESLNADKGYDQMIVEMLAGDELAPADPDVLRATGFLARNYHNSNRNIWLDATVEHTAKAFLAMTINCARCHDHKFDPLEQREYYAFRAIFEPHHVRTERLQGQPDPKLDGLARAFDAKPDEPTYLLLAGNEKHPDKEHPVGPAVPAAFGVALDIAPVELPNVAVFPSLRGFVEQEDVAAAEQTLAGARDKLSQLERTSSSQDVERKIARQSIVAAEAELLSLKARWHADKARYVDTPLEVDVVDHRKSAVIAEHRANVEKTKLTVLQKQQTLANAEVAKDKEDGEKQKQIETARQEVETAQQKLEEVSKAPKDDAEYTPVGESYPSTSTGRRLALARWIARPDNPLTARVAVNYVWMHHFGEPLVENVFDFGLRSGEPPHRQLLDWLAVELIEHDWSLKHLHRLIANARTYRLASSLSESSHFPAGAVESASQQAAGDKALTTAVSENSTTRSEINREMDPDNRLLWRANVRRLEAEVIRDSLLHVAGNLDRMQGGADIDFALGETVARRSVYFQHAYEKQMTMLVLFDAAAPTECYRRSPSIIPQQALALANSPLSFDQARLLAAKLESSIVPSGEREPDGAAFIRAAFELLLCRECTGIELRACSKFLVEQTALLSGDHPLTQLPGKQSGQTQPAAGAAERARENLIHTLMNHNDFVTIR